MPSSFQTYTLLTSFKIRNRNFLHAFPSKISKMLYNHHSIKKEIKCIIIWHHIHTGPMHKWLTDPRKWLQNNDTQEGWGVGEATDTGNYNTCSSTIHVHVNTFFIHAFMFVLNTACVCATLFYRRITQYLLLYMSSAVRCLDTNDRLGTSQVFVIIII